MPKAGHIQSREHREKISAGMSKVKEEWNKTHPPSDKWGIRGKKKKDEAQTV